MKTFRNLMLLLVTASLLSSCYVQDNRGRGHYRHGHGHRHGGPGWHRGH
ncbi:hypothetical protein OQY15_11310 [Pedobacter sp. MC2016-15]|nr:hypothetical protein [Pedobacter sp. MC2016-15]MCX2479674.1 hypothetical protein [Pedobacter sp. MC2016-15]